MKKMKVKNQEVNEIMEALKALAAAGIGFIALIIGIPAGIVLGLSRWMFDVAKKLVGGNVKENPTRVDPKRDDILAEIADV